MEPKIRVFLTMLARGRLPGNPRGLRGYRRRAGKDTRWKDVAQLKPQTTTKEEVAARRKRKLCGDSRRHA